MNAFGTVLRLLWRPWVLAFWVWIVAMAAALSLVSIQDDTGSVIDMWRTHVLAPEIATIVWRETIVLSFGVGLLLGFVGDEISRAPFAWSLPSLQTRLRVGTVPVALLVAGTAAVPQWHFFGATAAFAAAGVSTLACAFGAAQWLRPFPRALKRGMLVTALGVAVFPQSVSAIVEWNGIVVAIVAFALASFTMWMAAKRSITRGYVSFVQNAQTAFYNAMRPLPARRDGWLNGFSRPLQDATLPEWFRAACYSSGVRWGALTGPATGALYAGGMGYVVSSPFFVALAMFGEMSDLGQPMGRLAYPISRARRAQLCYVGNLLSTAIMCIVAGATYWLLTRFFGAHTSFAPRPWIGPVFPGVAIAFVWAPVARWHKSRTPSMPLAERVTGKYGLWLAGTYAVYMALVFGSVRSYQAFVSRAPMVAWAAGIAVLCVVTQIAFYWALRRTYAKGDLI